MKKHYLATSVFTTQQKVLRGEDLEEIIDLPKPCKEFKSVAALQLMNFHFVSTEEILNPWARTIADQHFRNIHLN